MREFGRHVIDARPRSEETVRRLAVPRDHLPLHPPPTARGTQLQREQDAEKHENGWAQRNDEGAVGEELEGHARCSAGRVVDRGVGAR